MCGRFTLTRQTCRELARLLRVDEDDLRDYRPRYNVAPTDQHFIVTSKYERRRAQAAMWGLVNSWATDDSRASQCINAKSETAGGTSGVPRSVPRELLCAPRTLMDEPDKKRGTALPAQRSVSFLVLAARYLV